jgi:ABC-type branched-subunit amino acid transport system substrate-binding protein
MISRISPAAIVVALAEGVPAARQGQGYQTTMGPVDLDERGNTSGHAFGIIRVQSGGATSAQVSNFGFGAHPACEDDDEGEEDE